MNIGRLDTIDQILVMAFILFIAFIVTALLIVTRENIRIWAMRKLSGAVVNMEQFNEWLQDDEKYDPQWMDYGAWKATRIEGRKHREGMV